MSLIDKYVEITENKSKYSPDEIVSVCKRINNPKRDFVFVNTFQGKHIPQKPSMIFEIYEELRKNLVRGLNSDEKVAIVGFAETATAIGNYMAAMIENCVYYTQTTRENFPSIKPLISFEEEHSHATSQKLYGDLNQLIKCDRIIFVEDEISTGRTILNFIKEFDKLDLNLKYSVVSLLNWQNDEWTEIFERNHINTYYVLRGRLKQLDMKVEAHTITEIEYEPCSTKVAYRKGKQFANPRIGIIPISIDEYLFNENLFLLNKYEEEGKEFLVVGTEECMFIPILFAKKLEELNPNVAVYFHATTRSPIETSADEGYALKARYKLRSAYDKNRTTYIYNLKHYDKVFIITDTEPTKEFVEDIVGALIKNSCNIEDIEIIQQ